MDYTVGSLAELVSGTKTANKIKIIQKSFVPVKKEVEEPSVKRVKPSPNKLKKERTKKLAVKIEPNEFTGESETSPIKKRIKIKSNQKVGSLTVSSDLSNKSEEPPIKPKGKKRRVESEHDLADNDHEEEAPPKKLRLSKNEHNAASRIKNKINKENKSSSEYKDKTLFVGNIPISITKKKLKKHFMKYGPINSIRIRGIPVANPNVPKKVAAIKKEFHPDRSTVYAFIRFENSEDAKKAEAENGLVFLEHHLRVHCCESTDKPDESKAIFVGNLPFNAEEEELWNLFKTCGPVSHVRIVRDGRTSMGKGFGYVNFKDTDSVQLALEMEKFMLKDRELRISLCDSNRAKKKKMGKKSKGRSRTYPNSKDQKSDDSASLKDKSSNNNHKKGTFTGTKFSDMKKKKRFNKFSLDKKKLAKKLVATQHS